jgi:hypothetical protein
LFLDEPNVVDNPPRELPIIFLYYAAPAVAWTGGQLKKDALYMLYENNTLTFI